jgi:DNA repair photolyase
MLIDIIKKQRFSNRNKLFRQYLRLVKENNSSIMYRMSEEAAEKDFDEAFLQTLIFSERKKAILKRHMNEIEKEVRAIFPVDNQEARKGIRNHCGKYTSIEVGFDGYKDGQRNLLEFNIGGIA